MVRRVWEGGMLNNGRDDEGVEGETCRMRFLKL